MTAVAVTAVAVTAVAVTAVDVVGAGDGFVAGYLSGLLDGLPAAGWPAALSAGRSRCPPSVTGRVCRPARKLGLLTGERLR